MRRIPMSLSVGLVRWVHAAEKMLTSLNAARNGNVLERGLGLLVAAGTVAEVMMPRWWPDLTLRRYGYEKLESGASKFFGEQIRNSGYALRTIQTGDAGASIELWTPPGEPEPVVATISTGRFGADDNLFVKVGWDPVPMFRNLVWRQGDALMVSAQNRGLQGLRYSVRRMTNPGQYVGSPDPRVVADRLSKAQSETRSLLLVGPTGSGKSTMARLIAQELAGEGARTLKIAGSVLKLCPFEVTLDLATYLQPTVLLLDDVPLASKVQMDDLLALFEALHGRTKLIISTYMDDDRPDDQADGDGVDYWPGMRPGRIDEVERLRRPSLDDRRLILSEYLASFGAQGSVPVEAIAEACDGLTGAYLKEVAYRVARYGVVHWEREVKAVRRTAPFPNKEPAPGDAPSAAPSKPQVPA